MGLIHQSSSPKSDEATHRDWYISRKEFNSVVDKPNLSRMNDSQGKRKTMLFSGGEGRDSSGTKATSQTPVPAFKRRGKEVTLFTQTKANAPAESR
jgi:hypothetical protein